MQKRQKSQKGRKTRTQYENNQDDHYYFARMKAVKQYREDIEKRNKNRWKK